MANLIDVRPKKAVKITLLDGVEREVKLTLNAMAELEDRFGSVDKAFELLDKNSMKALRAVLWASLIHEDPELTEQQVGNLMDINYMQELTSSLSTAFGQDMPSAEALTNGDDPNV